MTIQFTKTDPAERPLGRVAVAMLKFDETRDGPLGGCAITGFALWEPADGGDRPRLTMPARTYSVDGRRRRYDLLRPADPDSSTRPLEDAIIAAWLACGQRSAEVEIHRPA